MQTAFRSSDMFARLGGDEFVALLTKTKKLEAESVMGKLSAAINTYNNINADRGYDLSFSHGIVEFQQETRMTIEELLAQGDAKMYEIKRALNSI
jgi:diguanylate cyclase (GGDEF)-like protein